MKYFAAALIVAALALGTYSWSLRAPENSVTYGITYEAGNLLLGISGNESRGSYLIGFNGRALYTYDVDTPEVSNCVGTCAENWPPYLVSEVSVLRNVQSGIEREVGTMRRADGSLQITYDGRPLYFYSGDSDGTTHGEKEDVAWYLAYP